MSEKEKDVEKLTKLRMEKFGDKVLEMDEMEEVSGGTEAECAADVKFLEDLLGDEGKRMLKGWNKGLGDAFYRDYLKIKKAWAKVGIILQQNASDTIPNTYIIAETGRKLSREAALGYAKLYVYTKGGC